MNQPALKHRTPRLARAVIRQLVVNRVALLCLGHFLLFMVIYWAAFLLRFDCRIPDNFREVFWMTLPLVVAMKTVIFYFAGHYHGWWRYVTFADLAALLRAAAGALVVLTVVDHFFLPYHIPRAVLILDCLLGIVVIGALRASWRLFREQIMPTIKSKDFRWALLVGTDHPTGRLAHHIHSHPELQYRIAGFLATGKGTNGCSQIGHIAVVGSLDDDLGRIAAACRATEVLTTAGTLPGTRMRHLMDACNQAGLKLRILPPIEDRLTGDDRIPIRDIEISDLLHRDPVQLDSQAIAGLLEGRRVMVTGAGGSIGAEICRQIIKFNPAALILVGRGENRIFAIDRELRDLDTHTALCARIGDVADQPRMRQLFLEHRPEVVFHAAAHKHVPLMEANAGEAIKNNVGGTRVVANLADEFGVASFVFISTDKAVRPTSVMGASKHLAERYVCALSQESSTRFVVTRFGNVLGSTGSVVPIFQEQIRRGGPITVTDPEMTRYFMTIPEASQLVLQAAAMGRGGEIFVLDMGEPVNIVDLARDLVRLSGLPEDAVEIVYTGIRPGEKLHEELYFDDEETLPTSHPKLRAAYHRPYTLAEVQQTIGGLERFIGGPEDLLRRLLSEAMPEFEAQGPHAPDARQVSIPGPPAVSA